MNASAGEIWSDDLLERRKDAELLVSFIRSRFEERKAEGRSGAYVINLNAGWGHGKTYFLERLGRQLASEGHLTTYVNGWRDDASGEPLIAVMSALEEVLQPYFKGDSKTRKLWRAAKTSGAEIAVAIAKGTAKRFATKYLGEAVSEVAALVDKGSGPDSEPRKGSEIEKAAEGAVHTAAANIESLLNKYLDAKISDYRKQLEATDSFKRNFKAVLDRIDEHDDVILPLVVMIDELDRCRPTYAVEMLEQVKHLFDVENTVFIIATDGDQLAHSVQAIYGESFDGKAYLRRFFNRHYRFERRSLKEFVGFLFESHRIEVGKLRNSLNQSPQDLFVGAMQRFDITLRDAEQCFDILRSTVTLWNKNVPIETTLIIPLIVYFQQHKLDEMEAIMRPETAEANSLPQKQPWIIQTREVDDYGRPAGFLDVDVEQFNALLIRKAQKPLPENGRNDPTGLVATEIYEVLRDEFTILHRNAYTGKGPHSVILEYPELVRQVGRLTET